MLFAQYRREKRWIMVAERWIVEAASIFEQGSLWGLTTYRQFLFWVGGKLLQRIREVDFSSSLPEPG